MLNAEYNNRSSLAFLKKSKLKCKMQSLNCKIQND